MQTRQLSQVIKNRRKNRESYESIARGFGVSRALIRYIEAHPNYQPGAEKRKLLGIDPPATASITLAWDGDCPPGTQAPPATLGKCGHWFISNHPRRSKCFICSPYRKKREK